MREEKTMDEILNEMLEDETLVCKECGNDFVFTASEQAFYAEKGFVNKPKCCKACRVNKKNAVKEARQYYTTVCSQCGGEAKVTFRPSSDRPVYCSECYEQRTGSRK